MTNKIIEKMYYELSEEAVSFVEEIRLNILERSVVARPGGGVSMG